MPTPMLPHRSFSAKFQNHIEELLVAPIPNYLILAGYIAGGAARGLLVGIDRHTRIACFLPRCQSNTFSLHYQWLCSAPSCLH